MSEQGQYIWLAAMALVLLANAFLSVACLAAAFDAKTKSVARTALIVAVLSAVNAVTTFLLLRGAL